MLWNDLDSWRVKPGPTVDLMSMCVCVHVSCRLQKRAWKMRHWRRYAHVIIHNYMYVCIYIIIMTLSQPEGQSKSACCWIGRTARPLKEWRHVTSIFTTSMRHVIELVTLTSHPWPEKPKKHNASLESSHHPVILESLASLASPNATDPTLPRYHLIVAFWPMPWCRCQKDPKDQSYVGSVLNRWNEKSQITIITK